MLFTDLVPGPLTPAPTDEVEAAIPGGSTPASHAITSLTLQELSTIAGGWGSIDPI